MAQTRKKTRRLNPVAKSIVLFTMLIVSGVCLFNVFNELVLTKSLKIELQASVTKQEQLSNSKESLLTEKENLNDTEYLIRLARSKYLATKDNGEQVFKLPDGENEEENK